MPDRRSEQEGDSETTTPSIRVAYKIGTQKAIWENEAYAAPLRANDAAKFLFAVKPSFLWALWMARRQPWLRGRSVSERRYNRVQGLPAHEGMIRRWETVISYGHQAKKDLLRARTRMI